MSVLNPLQFLLLLLKCKMHFAGFANKKQKQKKNNKKV